MSARDMAWWQCDGNFDGSSWFCSHCGLQYFYGIDGFLFGIQMNDDPLSVTWYAAEPPTGLHQNYLDYMKFGTAIFNGSFDPDKYAQAKTAEERIRVLVNLIEKDNAIFKIALTDPRIKVVTEHIKEPVNPYPDRKFSVREDLLTLTLKLDEQNLL